MNKTKFILPLIALLSCTSCGTKIADRKATKGEVPEGGKIIENIDEKNEALLLAYSKAAKAIDTLEEFGAVATSDGLSLGLESEHVNGSVTLGSYELKVGGSNVFSGDKNNTKLGLTFSGFDSSINMSRVNLDGYEDYVLDESKNVYQFGLYLEKGNVYADLSNLGVPELLNKLAIASEPFLPAILESLNKEETNPVATLLTSTITEFAKSPEDVTKTIAPFFGSFTEESINNFEYKFAFKNVLDDSDYPLVSKSDIFDENINQDSVEQLKNNFTLLTSLNFFDCVNVYKYSGDAFGFQLVLNKEQLTAIFNKLFKTDFDYTIDEGSLKFVLYINEVGVPSLATLVNDMKLTLTGSEVESRYGPSLKVETHYGFDLTLSNNENPIEFPSFNSYNSLLLPF